METSLVLAPLLQSTEPTLGFPADVSIKAVTFGGEIRVYHTVLPWDSKGVL